MTLIGIRVAKLNLNSQKLNSQKIRRLYQIQSGTLYEYILWLAIIMHICKQYGMEETMGYVGRNI